MSNETNPAAPAVDPRDVCARLVEREFMCSACSRQQEAQHDECGMAFDIASEIRALPPFAAQQQSEAVRRYDALVDAVRDLELGRDERRRFEAGLAAKMGAKYGDNLFVQAERIVGERDAARAALAELNLKFERRVYPDGSRRTWATFDGLANQYPVSEATAAALEAAAKETKPC